MMIKQHTKNHITKKFDTVNNTTLQRYNFQEIRFLNKKELQTPTLQKNTSKYKKLQRKSWVTPLKLFFLIKKTPTLWKDLFKTSFVSTFWKKYCFVSKQQSFFCFKKRYRIYEKYVFDLKEKNRKYGPKPFNPRYEKYQKWWVKKRFSRMSRTVYKKYPWLNSLVFKRKVYRLTRKRQIKRLKNPWILRKYKHYRLWLKLTKRNSSKKRSKSKEGLRDVFYRRYIFLPYVQHSKSKHMKSKSRQFKKKVKKLQKTHKVSEGYNLRADFENKINITPITLNFSPSSYVSQELKNEIMFSVSNKVRTNTSPKNQNSFFSEIKFPKLNIINFWISKKIKNCSTKKFKNNQEYLNEHNSTPKYINNLVIFNNNEVKKNNYRLKIGEIINTNSIFTEKEKFFFFRKLFKKPVSNLYKLSCSKTIALIKHEFRSNEITCSNRTSNDQWTASCLHLKK